MGRRLLAVVMCACAVAPAAAAATTVTAPVYDAQGHLIQTPFVPAQNGPGLSTHHALPIVRADPKVKAWLSRYPKTGFTDQETFSASMHQWTVKIWWGKAGE